MKIAAFVTFLIVSSGVCVFAQDESNWPEPDPIVWKVCDGAAEEPLAFARAGFKGATPKFEKGTTAYVEQTEVDMLKCSDLCLAQRNGCLTSEWIESEKLCKLYQSYPESINRDNGKKGFKAVVVGGSCQMLQATQFREQSGVECCDVWYP